MSRKNPENFDAFRIKHTKRAKKHTKHHYCILSHPKKVVVTPLLMIVICVRTYAIKLSLPYILSHIVSYCRLFLCRHYWYSDSIQNKDSQYSVNTDLLLCYFAPCYLATSIRYTMYFLRRMMLCQQISVSRQTRRSHTGRTRKRR